MENKDIDFKQGLYSGAGNLDKSNYEGFLSHEVQYNWLEKHYSRVETDYQDVTNKLDAAEFAQRMAYGHIAENQARLDQTQRTLSHLQADQDELTRQMGIIHDKKELHHTPYALLAGILYLLAGVAFVTGDLIISHEIVAYALNIRDNVEAWTFAIGLASLSVLLKPAYERLVENPYLRNRTPEAKRVYNYFQAFLLVFTIGTMAILGWFRYEAYKTEQLKRDINQQIKAMQLEAQPIDATQPVDNPALIQKIEAKMQAYTKLGLDLVNSPWALLSFVLSGVLFAIAGAICLGIAFPILHSYWYRWLQAGPATRRLRKKLAKVRDEYATVEQKLFDYEKQLAIQKNELELLPDFTELRDKRDALRQELIELTEKLRKEDENRRIYTHADGFEFGNSSQLTAEEREQLRKTRLKEFHQSQEDQPDRQPRLYRTNGMRPHQALRRAISNGFNEN